MKYFAILKDSLRETIDSKVLFVVVGISLLAICLMGTLSLTPNPPDEALQKLAVKFPDGAWEVEMPILGKVKVTEPTTEYSVQDLKGTEDASKPWQAEYQFTLESRDRQPLGGRTAVLFDILQEEERQEKANPDAKRKTRWHQLNEEMGEEVRRIQEREEAKGRQGGAQQQRLLEEMRLFLARRLEQELRSLRSVEMEEFVKQQLENQGNWRVVEVKMLDLPPAERNFKIKRKVLIQDGDEGKIKSEEVDGEVNKFAVTIVSRDGTYRVWPHKATLLFGAIPIGGSRQPGRLAYQIQSWLAGWAGASVILLLSCVITAFYVPNMLRKGTIDLLLAKPVNRVSLLIYKYIGGLTFMFINTTVLILGLWIALGLRTSIWEPAFLTMILTMTFQFSLFYALSTLAAVLTRSPIVAILLSVLLWAVLFGMGWAYRTANATRELKGKAVADWVYTTVDVGHAVLPHYMDLDQLGDKVLYVNMLSLSEAERSKVDKDYAAYGWGETLLVTSLYIVLLLGLSCWRFAMKDY